MPMPQAPKPEGRWLGPYRMALGSFLLFAAFAFCVDSPADIGRGLLKILTSRSLLTTDYMALGGLGAAFVSAALTCSLGVLLLAALRVPPGGQTLMVLWMTAGYSFFGVNALNASPIVLGTFLYARFRREAFQRHALSGLLGATLSPVVSEFAFSGRLHPAPGYALGALAGMALGFVMPALISAALRLHGGYSLYNAGAAGGIIALFLAALAGAAGLNIERPHYWSTGNNLPLGVFLYVLMLFWMLPAFFTKKPGQIISGLGQIFGDMGRPAGDYYRLHGSTAYLNMGLCGMLGTTVTLAMGADLNGGTFSGILTMMGFGALGLHVVGCLPLMAGAIAGAFINPPPPTEPANIIPILFSAGLAPIAGHYGWGWGLAAGFLHLALVHQLGQATGGLNLYNNGFVAAFVALVLVPVIKSLKRGTDAQKGAGDL